MNTLKPPPVPESSLSAQILEALRWKAWRVSQSSHLRRRCPTCDRIDPRGDGADRGLPDLLARWREWPSGLWAGLELKHAQGRLSPEQRELEREGGIVVVRSIEEAECVLRGQREEVER